MWKIYLFFAEDKHRTTKTTTNTSFVPRGAIKLSLRRWSSPHTSSSSNFAERTTKWKPLCSVCLFLFSSTSGRTGCKRLGARHHRADTPSLGCSSQHRHSLVFCLHCLSGCFLPPFHPQFLSIISLQLHNRSVFVCILIVEYVKGHLWRFFFSGLSEVLLAVCGARLNENVSSATLSGATMWSCWFLWLCVCFFQLFK